MKKLRVNPHSSLPMVAESLLHLFVMVLSLVDTALAVCLYASSKDYGLDVDAVALDQLYAVYSPSVAAAVTFLLFLVLGGARLIRAFRFREKGTLLFRTTLAQAAVFFVCALITPVFGFSITTTLLVGMLWGAAMITGRIVSMIRDHRVRKVVPNVLAVLVLLSIMFLFPLMLLAVFFLSVLAIMAMIFSRISFSVLKKIIRKTYAGEIIFGLFLLIVTFSLLLWFFEPGITNLPDALWYCFAIVTTIGFGDLTAVEPFGRVLSVILGAYGIIVVALITSIIVNFYGEMKKDGGDPEQDPAAVPDASGAGATPASPPASSASESVPSD